MDEIEVLQVRNGIGADLMDQYVMLALGHTSGDLDPLYGLDEQDLRLVLRLIKVDLAHRAA